MHTEPVYARPTKRAAASLLESAGLPVSDLTDAHMEHFFFSGPGQAPTGLVGLELCGQDALLRSLVVTPGCRSAGLGKTLTRHAEEHARACGVRTLYLLTTTAETFFRKNGYATADRATAPLAIRSTREFADICPASSAFLFKELYS